MAVCVFLHRVVDTNSISRYAKDTFASVSSSKHLFNGRPSFWLPKRKKKNIANNAHLIRLLSYSNKQYLLFDLNVFTEPTGFGGRPEVTSKMFQSSLYLSFESLEK